MLKYNHIALRFINNTNKTLLINDYKSSLYFLYYLVFVSCCYIFAIIIIIIKYKQHSLNHCIIIQIFNKLKHSNIKQIIE